MCFSGKNKMLRSIFGNKNAPVTVASGSAATAAEAAAPASLPAMQPAATNPSATDEGVAPTTGPATQRSQLTQLLAAAGVAERRPNGLTLADFLRTYRLLRAAGVSFRVAGQQPRAGEGSAAVAGLAAGDSDSD
jgi:hypothetical protein